MNRVIIAVLLALGLLLLAPSTVSAAPDIEITNRVGDGVWIGDIWKVDVFAGEEKFTTLTLYNSSSSSLEVEVNISPDSLDNENLTFELDKTDFTMPSRSYTDVTMSIRASGSATPGTYAAELEIKSEMPPSPAGGGGISAPDTAPPKISGVWLCAKGVTETRADICWATDEKSDSQVEYWTSPSILSPLDEAYVTEHHVTLTGLIPGTTYHYRTMSRDWSGNLAVSDEYLFTTLRTEEPTPVEPEEPEPEVLEPEEPEVIEPEEPEVIEPEPEPETPWALIGGVIGVAAAIAGGGWYWLWRRRETN